MSKDAENHQRLVASVRDAARMMGISRSSVYRLIGNRKLRTVKIGARRLIPLGAINALLNEAGE
jgi:excisionase family DNA binding protein